VVAVAVTLRRASVKEQSKGASSWKTSKKEGAGGRESVTAMKISLQIAK